MNLPSLSYLDSLIKAVVQLGKGSVALIVAKRVYICVNIGIKSPVAQYVLMRKVEVVVFGLSPYEIELGSDDKGRNVKDEMWKGKTEAFGNHNGITSEGNERRRQTQGRRDWLGCVRSRDDKAVWRKASI